MKGSWTPGTYLMYQIIYMKLNVIYFFTFYLDDPYYCGMRARIPAFVQRALPQRKKGEAAEARERELASRSNGHGMPPPNGHVILPNGHHMPVHHPPRYAHGPPVPGHPMMWHAKSVDSGMGTLNN